MNFSNVFGFDTREACGLAFGVGRKGWMGLTFPTCLPNHAHSVSLYDGRSVCKKKPLLAVLC